MTIERMHSGFAFSGDAKVTKFDGRTGELVGGQAGWLTDDTIFIGGAGYWLANGSHDRKMAYGGLVVQWLARANERVGFSAKGLFGGGQATLSDTITYALPLPHLLQPAPNLPPPSPPPV